MDNANEGQDNAIIPNPTGGVSLSEKEAGIQRRLEAWNTKYPSADENNVAAREELEEILQDYNAIDDPSAKEDEEGGEEQETAAPTEEQETGAAEQQEKEKEEEEKKKKDAALTPNKEPDNSDNSGKSMSEVLFESLKKAATQVGIAGMLRASPPGRIIEQKVEKDITKVSNNMIQKNIVQPIQKNVIQPLRNAANTAASTVWAAGKSVANFVSPLSGTPKDPNNTIQAANAKKSDAKTAAQEQNLEQTKANQEKQENNKGPSVK